MSDKGLGSKVSIDLLADLVEKFRNLGKVRLGKFGRCLDLFLD